MNFWFRVVGVVKIIFKKYDSGMVFCSPIVTVLKIMRKCAIGGSFQSCSCKTLQNFVPFVCILCS